MAEAGAGRYLYEMEEGWGQLSEGWTFGNVTGVAVDSQEPGHHLPAADGPAGHRVRPGRELPYLLGKRAYPRTAYPFH